MRNVDWRWMSGALLASFALMGCGLSVKSTPLRSSTLRRAPRLAEQVELAAGDRDRQPYREVALIEVEPSSSFVSYEKAELIEAARSKAGELGCDAIRVEEPKTQSGGVIATCLVKVKPMSAGAS